jgi:hypothetical protein
MRRRNATPRRPFSAGFGKTRLLSFNLTEFLAVVKFLLPRKRVSPEICSQSRRRRGLFSAKSLKLENSNGAKEGAACAKRGNFYNINARSGAERERGAVAALIKTY